MFFYHFLELFMKNLRNSAIALIAILFTVSVISMYAEDAKPIDAKQLFQDKKCNSCHSVDAIAIAKTNANSKAPDLSNIGSTADADYFTKYLKKEVEHEGKKHGMAFKGTDDELKALATWLSGLKTEKK